jgi:hypothetical protein
MKCPECRILHHLSVRGPRWPPDTRLIINKKCSLNWKLCHPEPTRHVFLKFSPGFSVKFTRFGEHFSLKTPIECVQWPENVNKPNLVFLHILECTIRNTFLTNINLGRLSDIASHCKKLTKAHMA